MLQKNLCFGSTVNSWHTNSKSRMESSPSTNKTSLTALALAIPWNTYNAVGILRNLIQRLDAYSDGDGDPGASRRRRTPVAIRTFPVHSDIFIAKCVSPHELGVGMQNSRKLWCYRIKRRLGPNVWNIRLVLEFQICCRYLNGLKIYRHLAVLKTYK